MAQVDKPAAFTINGATMPATPLAPGLYVVATPIGNLSDITIRALETLAAADLVLCEDTRHSATLLDHYGIRTSRQALHEHNERARVDAIAAMIAGGNAVALISDAGTPLLSDPGFPLVRALRKAGLPVFAVPGPSALLSALAVAGLPTDSFTFLGFLPPKAEARRKAIAAIADRRETLVIYESPRRLGESLAALAGELGPRDAAVALELTKRFERVFSGPLADLAERFAAEETKGEAVILIAGATGPTISDADWQGELTDALADQPLRVAVDEITARYGLKRKQVYDRALAIKAEE